MFFGAIPPPRNFAKIHARGGRGLLPVQPKDSIPPWGHTGARRARRGRLCRSQAGSLRGGRGKGTTARYVGRHLDDWKVPMPDGRHWTVERDGSVTDPSAEVVSPVCRYEDIEMVQEVVRGIRAAGAKADGSCGIHIHIGLGEHTIEFRAFNGTLHAGEIKAYIQLCLAISAQALSTKAASSTRPVTDNPKYTFRCWLLRLGFIGDEFSTAREHLLKKLPGNAAWRQAS